MFQKIIKFLHNFFSKKVATPEPEKIEVIPEKQPQRVESRRNEDLSAEAQLAYFMDKYLYADFPTRNAFASIRRIYDKEEQLHRVDVEFVGTDGKVFYVDEKAQLYYLNQDLPTFAFELLFKRGAYDTTGWLCNSTLKTDFYMLIWPSATQNTCKGIRWEQFTRADCLLIQKSKILKMLASKGLTVERLQEDARSIRASGQTGKIPISNIRGIYYYASDPSRYKEAPINIIISKPILIELAQRRYIVTPDNIITT